MTESPTWVTKRDGVYRLRKEAIAHCAAQLIPDDTSMFINIGTTTEQVARHLVGRVGLLVITNNINVVNTLRECETIQVMTAGGIVRREDGGIVGDATVDFIAQFKVDFAVVGASSDRGRRYRSRLRSARSARGSGHYCQCAVGYSGGGLDQIRTKCTYKNCGHREH